MRRFIAIIIVLQFCIMPFCPVFAMHPIYKVDLGYGCNSIQHNETTFQTNTHSDLSCCSESKHPSPSQLNEFFFDFSTCFIKQTDYQETIFLTGQPQKQISFNAKHPPDDFERSSRSKRE